MDTIEVNFGAEFHTVTGFAIQTDDLIVPLAQSLAEYVATEGGRDFELIEILRSTDGPEYLVLRVRTSCPQEPAFPILPEEKICIFFLPGSYPIVVPLRKDFPSISHSYGLPVGFPTTATMILCIDDRPWSDAEADYNGPEILRRIFSWFDRAGSGELNDVFQPPDLAFLPSTVSIVMSSELDRKILKSDSEPVFLSLYSPEGGSDLFEALLPADIPDGPDDGMEWIKFVAIALAVEVENTGAMWRTPSHLGHLRESLSGAQYDLLDELRKKISDYLQNRELDRNQFFHAKLLFRVFVRNTTADRVESLYLLVDTTIGEIGAALGLLWPPNADAESDYTPQLPQSAPVPEELATIRLFQANHYTKFDQIDAAAYSGRGETWREALSRSAIAFGAGSIGSQVLDSMVREGAFSDLTIVDDDYLAPHNLARHTLAFPDVGRSKANQLSEALRAARPDLKTASIKAKISRETTSPEMATALRNAEIVLDLTASVGASRTISDEPDRGRAASAFFNPAGNSVVVMVEDTARLTDLATLEAIYYGELVKEPKLYNHLAQPDKMAIGAGQCRATTNRMPSSSAAILSGIAAKHLGYALAGDAARIFIHSMNDDCGADPHNLDFELGTQTLCTDGWTVRLPNAVAQSLQKLREASLPNETGGVLLGIMDHSRRRIEITCGLPAPTDSVATQSTFERGVANLRADIDQAASATMHQIAYVGEWHSHPDGASTSPSAIDCEQLAYLRQEFHGQQRPTVMLIVGDGEASLIFQRVN